MNALRSVVVLVLVCTQAPLLLWGQGTAKGQGVPILSLDPAHQAPSPPFLSPDVDPIPVNSGSDEIPLGDTIYQFQLRASSQYAGHHALLLPTLGGTSSGVSIGDVHVPISPDALTGLFLRSALDPSSSGGVLGTLDANGRATLSLVVPATAAITLRGRALSVASVIVSDEGAIVAASNAVSQTLGTN